jgi:hypothetical protein
MEALSGTHTLCHIDRPCTTESRSTTLVCDCLDCRVAWEDSQEAEYALRLLAAQDEQIRQAKPATDAEWAAFMDAEFPRVEARS